MLTVVFPLAIRFAPFISSCSGQIDIFMTNLLSNEYISRLVCLKSCQTLIHLPTLLPGIFKVKISVSAGLFHFQNSFSISRARASIKAKLRVGRAPSIIVKVASAMDAIGASTSLRLWLLNHNSDEPGIAEQCKYSGSSIAAEIVTDSSGSRSRFQYALRNFATSCAGIVSRLLFCIEVRTKSVCV
jgi:hypothetical protein